MLAAPRPTSVSVLITGETGTGKEVLASAIHQMGARASKPFIAINCAAIQSTVLESELFGYESGAFTGADKRKHGLMEVAEGGVLFLDEISWMPVEMQVKFLRALEERAFRRVGGTNLIHVDVQILAASNRNLIHINGRGAIPRRSILPVEGSRPALAAVARAQRRYSRAGWPVHSQEQSQNGLEYIRMSHPAPCRL